MTFTCNPARSVTPTLWLSPRLYKAPMRGVIPDANPICMKVAITKSELTKAAAASSSVPYEPTIMVSAKLTTMIPSCVTNTGSPRRSRL